MKVLHYSSEFDDKTVYHHEMCSDFGESNTDKTFYRPDFDCLRSTVSASPKVGLYDFPDGNDTGERYQPILRNKGIDVTEVNQILDNITNIITDKKAIDKEKLSAEIEKAKAELKSKEDSKQFANNSTTTEN